MSFYGNITNVPSNNFTFDVYYPNRYTMKFSAPTDSVYIGRYGAIEYNEDWNKMVGEENKEATLYYLYDNGWSKKIDDKTPLDTTICVSVLTNNTNKTTTYTIKNSETTISQELTFSEGTKSENINYLVNYYIDFLYFKETYDSTGWVKELNNNGYSYKEIADLNGVVPTFDIALDPPSEVPEPIHLDAELGNLNYKVHDQPSWGFRVKEALDNKPTDIKATRKIQYCWVNNSDNTIETDSNKIDDKTKYTYKKCIYHYTAGEWEVYDPTSDYSSEEYLGPSAIYFNMSGFKRDTENTISDPKDIITVLPTGQSGLEYQVHAEGSGNEGGANYKTSKSKDIYELTVHLPSLGNAVAEMWNIVYGKGDSGNGNARNTEIAWNNTDGLRDPDTLAGCINSVHDLMGQIIVTGKVKTSGNGEIELTFPDRSSITQHELFEKLSSNKVKYEEVKDYIYSIPESNGEKGFYRLEKKQKVDATKNETTTYYEFISIPEFATSLNTINGQILNINRILEAGDKDTRDLNTVQGAINKLNDLIKSFDEDNIKPNKVVTTDKEGKIIATTAFGEFKLEGFSSGEADAYSNISSDDTLNEAMAKLDWNFDVNEFEHGELQTQINTNQSILGEYFDGKIELKQLKVNHVGTYENRDMVLNSAQAYVDDNRIEFTQTPVKDLYFSEENITIGTKFKNIDSTTEDLGGRVQSLEGYKDDNDKVIGTINNNIETINDDITTINSDIDIINKNIDSIEENVQNIHDNLSASIEGLQNNIDSQSIVIAEIQDDINSQDSSITELSTTLSGLQDTVSNISPTNLYLSKLKEYGSEEIIIESDSVQTAFDKIQSNFNNIEQVIDVSNLRLGEEFYQDWENGNEIEKGDTISQALAKLQLKLETDVAVDLPFDGVIDTNEDNQDTVLSQIVFEKSKNPESEENAVNIKYNKTQAKDLVIKREVLEELPKIHYNSELYCNREELGYYLSSINNGTESILANKFYTDEEINNNEYIKIPLGFAVKNSSNNNINYFETKGFYSNNNSKFYIDENINLIGALLSASSCVIYRLDIKYNKDIYSSSIVEGDGKWIKLGTETTIETAFNDVNEKITKINNEVYNTINDKIDDLDSSVSNRINDLQDIQENIEQSPESKIVTSINIVSNNEKTSLNQNVANIGDLKLEGYNIHGYIERNNIYGIIDYTSSFGVSLDNGVALYTEKEIQDNQGKTKYNKINILINYTITEMEATVYYENVITTGYYEVNTNSFVINLKTPPAVFPHSFKIYRLDDYGQQLKAPDGYERIECDDQNIIQEMDSIIQAFGKLEKEIRKTPGQPGAANNAEIFNDYENNRAIGPYTHASGLEAQAGITGYYFTNLIIINEDGFGEFQLSKTQGSLDKDFVINYEENDIISYVYGSKYLDIATITSIDNNDKKITVKPLGDKKLGTGDIGTDIDDQILYVKNKPNDGIVYFGHYAHAEGEKTQAIERSSHAEGRDTIARGQYGHAEGRETKAGYAAHAEGYKTNAAGNYSHTEGWANNANGQASHAEGRSTNANGLHTHAEGYDTTAIGNYSHAEGFGTIASHEASHSEGRATKANGQYSHAEGAYSITNGANSHAEGHETVAYGVGSHTEGHLTKTGQFDANNDYIANTGNYAHAEGTKTLAGGDSSHSEGYLTIATASAAHAEGTGSQALTQATHAEGYHTVASARFAHAEGRETVASGENSHAEGWGTVAVLDSQHVQGEYNKYVDDNGNPLNYAHIVGNGSSDLDRSNAHTLDWNGNAWFAGKVTAEVEPKNEKDLTTKKYVDDELTWYKNQFNGDIYNIENKIKNIDTGTGDYSVIENKDTKAIGYASHAQGLNTQAGGKAFTIVGMEVEELPYGVLVTNKRVYNPDTGSGENPYVVGCGYGDIFVNEDETTVNCDFYSKDYKFLDSGIINKKDDIESEGREENNLALYLKHSHFYGGDDDSYYIVRSDRNLPKNGTTNLELIKIPVQGSYYLSISEKDFKTILKNIEKENLKDLYYSAAISFNYTDVNTNEKKSQSLSAGDRAGQIVSHSVAKLGEQECIKVTVNPIYTPIQDMINGNGTDYSSWSFERKENLEENGIDQERNIFRLTDYPQVGNRPIGYATFAAGNEANASSKGAVAIGDRNKAHGAWSTAFGRQNEAGFSAFAAGMQNKAIGEYSFAEGKGNTITASGMRGHVEGSNNTVNGYAAHAEGYGTNASGQYQHVQGKYNIIDKEDKYAHIVGNGSSSAPRNAHTLDWSGNAWFAGNITSQYNLGDVSYNLQAPLYLGTIRCTCEVNDSTALKCGNTPLEDKYNPNTHDITVVFTDDMLQNYYEQIAQAGIVLLSDGQVKINNKEALNGIKDGKLKFNATIYYTGQGVMQ